MQCRFSNRASFRGLQFALASLLLAGSAFGDGSATETPSPNPRLVEVAEDVGLAFTHDNGMIGERWIVETVGAGVGVLDFDGDGRLDVWLVQGGPLTGQGERPSDQLFRNVSHAGNLGFENVTAASSVRANGYGMGIASGDMDNDGDEDVFLANFGSNQLFENLGDGRFRDVTKSAGLAESEWSVSASWADIDGDGLLDLYVVNYLDYAIKRNKVCRDLVKRPAYCAPSAYVAASDRLYRNLGEGRFQDISASAGIGDAVAPGLGVVSLDFEADGDVDFYVANDGKPNMLWLNRGEGSFVDKAAPLFVDVNANGASEAGMGIDAEDYDGDCDVDLFVTHLATETNTLYVNNGDWFSDDTIKSGLSASSAPFTGFGTGFFDLENDGDLDLFSANGAVSAVDMLRAAGDPYPLSQRDQVWLNDGSGRFHEMEEPALAQMAIGRGAAFADLDNDGDIDIVVANNSGKARLYRNDAGSSAWLGLDVRGGAGEVAVGAEVWLDSSPCPRRRVATDGSYASANDPRIVVGRGADKSAQLVRVRWPDGTLERFGPLSVGTYHRLQRGSGPPEADAGAIP